MGNGHTNNEDDANGADAIADHGGTSDKEFYTPRSSQTDITAGFPLMHPLLTRPTLSNI